MPRSNHGCRGRRSGPRDNSDVRATEDPPAPGPDTCRLWPLNHRKTAEESPSEPAEHGIERSSRPILEPPLAGSDWSLQTVALEARGLVNPRPDAQRSAQPEWFPDSGRSDRRALRNVQAARVRARFRGRSVTVGSACGNAAPAAVARSGEGSRPAGRTSNGCDEKARRESTFKLAN
jgi:hypothetical protein